MASSGSGRIGSSCLDMRRARKPVPTTVNVNNPTTRAEDHPHSLPFTIERANAEVAAVIRIEPSMSGRRTFESRLLSGRTRAPQMRAPTPTGTLRANAQRQELSSMTTPPIIGPTTEDKAKVELQIVTAVARRSAGHEATAIPKEAGAAIAAPTPIRPRAAMSSGTVGATASKSDPKTKQAKPVFRTRTRPNRSAQRPLTIRAPA